MIPKIVKGAGITGSIRYAMGQGNDAETGERLTLAPGEESRAKILGGQNFGYAIDSAERLETARRMMEWNAMPDNQASRSRKCEKDCLHASLSWEKGQEPTAAEMTEAAKSFLKSLGMENALAVFVAHNDTDHRHLHIVASRIDPATGKTYSQENDFSKGQAWSLQWEREHGQISKNPSRQKLHQIVDAIEARDGAALVGRLTERNPTFTARELDKTLSYGTLSKEERTEFRNQILAHENVVGLRETADLPVTRYTTRDVLASERALMRDAQKLAGDHSHGLNEGRIAATAAEFTLKPEQAEALRHLTGAEGFAILWGEAGTGKSHTLNAARAAYEAEGMKVVGLAWTNEVVQQMRGDGFTANTITSELNALEMGRTAWGKNTVLIVDEAAMIATEHLAALTSAARKAGAAVRVAGDDAQLPSIERGGMFETLRQTHGAAILKDVQRVSTDEEKTAFNQMHKGEFRGALGTFDRAGGIHWTEKQSHALRDMAGRYTADLAAAPDKRRFMFAFTNAEVATLNAHARSLHRSRGDLGEDHKLATASGPAEFAAGDRIQFTGNGYSKREKSAGLTNGRVGTITAIDTGGDRPRLTVALDTAKGAKSQEVSFIVGENGAAGEFNRFKHGYAGTIYRGQGRTLDESYVCHSSLWRSSAAYVALTRHRDAVHIFAARETVKDLDAMAQGLARPENKRAATAYQVDDASAVREAFGEAGRAAADRQRAIHNAASETQIAANASSPQPTQGTALKMTDTPARAFSTTGKEVGRVEKAVQSMARILGSLFGGSSSPARTEGTGVLSDIPRQTKPRNEAPRSPAMAETAPPSPTTSSAAQGERLAAREATYRAEPAAKAAPVPIEAKKPARDKDLLAADLKEAKEAATARAPRRNFSKRNDRGRDGPGRGR
ncbi:MAG: AAA family ATPase [Beijerinckiaceae bacterium]